MDIIFSGQRKREREGEEILKHRQTLAVFRVKVTRASAFARSFQLSATGTYTQGV